MENHKRLHLACDDKDIISNLPQHLIASILERLPVQDAVRTSILSKNWRYRWTTMTVLVDALLIRLFDTPCFNRVALYFLKPVKDFVRVERMNLARLLSNLPKIRRLQLDGHFLKYLSAEEIPKWLPCAVDSLIHLRLELSQFSDLDQLHAALCLIRNSPNLEILQMQWHFDPHVMHYDVGPASNHLESRDCLDHTLNNLRTVEIAILKGSRPELLLIKVLLAHSRSLEKLTIQPSGTFDLHERLNIALDVMRFPRASPKAEVIFLNPKP